MNDKRREILIGYLLGALEPQESAKVDAEMQNNEDLRNDLAVLYREISPINEIADHYEPPVGLATRTCRNLWAKIDSDQNSQTTDALRPSKPNHKKRKITVVVLQNDHQQKEEPVITPHSTLHTPHSDTAIPLSQALLLAPQNPPGIPSKILRRVDQGEEIPDEPHLLLADSMVIAKNHPPRHYGRKSIDVTTKIKRPWTIREVFASLLVGLVAAVVIFPLIQMGINNFREMITQQQIQNFANSMPPNTSQSSLYGLSPNDVRIITNMNLDAQSATASYNQRQSMPDPFAEFLESLGPTLLPSTLSNEASTVRQPDSTTTNFLSGSGDLPK